MKNISSQALFWLLEVGNISRCSFMSSNFGQIELKRICLPKWNFPLQLSLPLRHQSTSILMSTLGSQPKGKLVKIYSRKTSFSMQNESKSIECFFGCMGDLIRKELKCSFEFDYESEDYARCMEGPNAEFEECLRADECIQVDGTCMKR